MAEVVNPPPQDLQATGPKKDLVSAQRERLEARRKYRESFSRVLFSRN